MKDYVTLRSKNNDEEPPKGFEKFFKKKEPSSAD
jgi:hypothetical protein